MALVRQWPIVAYALPAFSNAFMHGPASSIVPTLYATHFGLSLALVGSAVFISRLFDAVTDPLIGYFSDRTSGRFGRRRPWVLAGALVTTPAIYMLYVPPQPASYGWFLGWFMLTYVGWTMSEVPHAAWGAEITRDYERRSRIFTVRNFMIQTGTLAFFVLPLLPIFPTTAMTPDTLRAVALMIVVIVPLMAVAAVIWGPAAQRADATERPSLRTLLGIVRGNKPLWWFLFAYLLEGFAIGMYGSLSFLYISDYLGLATSFAVLFIVLQLAGLAFMPAALAIINRVGKHRAWGSASLIGLMLFPLMLLVPHGQAAFMPLVLLLIPIGCTNTIVAIAPASLLGDVIDYDTWKSGQRRAATYTAIFALGTKLNGALGAAAAFTLVGLFGYRPELGAANSAAAITGLKASYVAIPALINLAALYFMWTFPIDRRRQAIIRRRIETRERRAEGVAP